MYRSAGPQGPSTETVTIPGSTPATWARGTLVLQGSARHDGANATPFMLFSILMGESGATAESVTINAIVQCHTEGTHASHACWHIIASGRRTNGGASVRTSMAGGGGSGQVANTFSGPKPSVAVSDPSSAVAPNVSHRIGIVVTPKLGEAMCLEYTAIVTRGKVV